MRQRASTEPVPGVQSEIGNGAIVAEELKLGRRIGSGRVECITRPDPDLPRFFTPPLLSRRLLSCFVFPTERLEQASYY